MIYSTYWRDANQYICNCCDSDEDSPPHTTVLLVGDHDRQLEAVLEAAADQYTTGYCYVRRSEARTAHDLRWELLDLVADRRSDVLLIAYRGTMGPTGATLSMSRGQGFNVYELRRLFAEYWGTLIQFFDVPGIEQHAPWPFPSPTFPVLRGEERYKHITAYAVGADRLQDPKASMRVFASLFGKTYEQLRESARLPLNTEGTAHLVIETSQPYAGTFPGPARKCFEKKNPCEMKDVGMVGAEAYGQMRDGGLRRTGQGQRQVGRWRQVGRG